MSNVEDQPTADKVDGTSPPERQRCCVPYCRRTYKFEGHLEIMCGKHYRLASPILRRRIVRLRRKARRTMDPAKLRRIYALDLEIWGRIKKQAIEIALGI